MTECLGRRGSSTAQLNSLFDYQRRFTIIILPPNHTHLSPAGTFYLRPSSKALMNAYSRLEIGSVNMSRADETDSEKETTKSAERAKRKASLELQIIIVGGGIAGLACGHALAQAGHHVRILEKSDGLGQPSGGLRVPPNFTKILWEWGLSEELAKAAQSCHKSTFFDLETGETLGFLEWKEDVIKETGGDILLIHHSDLHRILYDLAISSGVAVDFNCTVTSVAVDEATKAPHVHLANGQVVKGDIAIGADGYSSIVRQAITGKGDRATDTGISTYVITIPADLMRSDPEIAHLPDLPEWPVWMGTNRSVFGYPTKGGKLYNLSLFWPDHAVHTTDEREGWKVWPTDTLDLGGSNAIVQRLVRLMPTALRTRYTKRELPEEWFDKSNLLLIGEAAHPLMPGTWSGGGLGVEDASVLGTLFSHLRDRTQIPVLLQAFQDIRQPRCLAVQQNEVANAELTWMPPGEERDKRNELMRKSLLSKKEFWDETKLRQQWESVSDLFGYCARDEAEDWWVKWGILDESSKEIPAFDPLLLTFEMTEVTSPTVLFSENAIMV